MNALELISTVHSGVQSSFFLFDMYQSKRLLFEKFWLKQWSTNTESKYSETAGYLEIFRSMSFPRKTEY